MSKISQVLTVSRCKEKDVVMAAIQILYVQLMHTHVYIYIYYIYTRIEYFIVAIIIKKFIQLCILILHIKFI